MKAKKSFLVIGSIWLIILFACLPLATSFAKSTPSPANKAKNLEIGVLASLSGFGSASLTLVREGAQAAEEWFNKQGGITINGQQYLIKLIAEDTKGTADGAVAAANKMVYEHNVKFIVGCVMTFINKSVLTVTEPAKVLRCALYNTFTPVEYGPNTPYTFLGGEGTIEGCKGLLPYIRKTFPEVKTAVINSIDAGAAPYVFKIVKSIAEEEGFTVLGGVNSWPPNTVEFTPIIAKALALKPDMVIMTNGWPAAFGAMLKAAREAGFTGPITGCHNSCADVLQVAGPAASTNYFACGIDADSPGMTPIIKEVTPRLKEKYGHALYYNYWGFNGLYVLVKAIEAAQSLDPTVVKDSWEKMKTIDSIYGSSPMCGLKTYGINHTVCHPVAVQSLMNGKVNHIKWSEVHVP